MLEMVRELRDEMKAIRTLMESRYETQSVPDNMIPLQVNPPDIVTIEDDEFRIDMNNMKPGRPYMMKFEGSTYVILKNGDGALVMEEVEI